jgi:hypothetical protein
MDSAAANSLMSAFLQSGRSDHQKLSEIKVRFRPEADIDGDKYNAALGGAF